MLNYNIFSIQITLESHGILMNWNSNNNNNYSIIVSKENIYLVVYSINL